MNSRLLKRAGFRFPAVVSCLLAATSTLMAGDAKPTDEQDIRRLRADAVVPSREFMTIQAAINAVGNGGSIFVKPGVYREQLTIRRKRIRLTGYVPNRPTRQAILGVAKANFPSFEVVDRMNLARGVPSADMWLGNC